MTYDSIALILVALCMITFIILMIVDHFQEPSPEEFEAWAAQITRYENRTGVAK